MPRSKGLGRGLSALIGESPGISSTDGGPREVPLDAVIASRFQPRKDFDEVELEELAESIRKYGIIQPVLVREIDGGYELIAGERRLRAARRAGLSSISAWVRPATDVEMLAMALVENVQRENLNPLEEAEAYQRLTDDLGWTQDVIAGQVGKARSHVANYLRLLRLDPRIRDWIRGGKLSMAHAKVLLSMEDESQRLDLAEAAVVKGWTVRELDDHRIRLNATVKAASSRALDVHMRQVEEGLRRALGSGVKVRGDGEKGRIEIRYRSLEELERLIEILGRSEDVPERFPV